MNKYFIFEKEQKIHLPKEADKQLFEMLVRSYAHVACDVVCDTENEVVVGSCSPVPVGDSDFVINADEGGLYITGTDYPATIRGFITVLDKLVYVREKKGYGIECGVVREKAAIQFRSVHLCVFEQTDYDFLRKCVRACGIAKYSHVVLEFWGMLKYDCMKELGWEQAYSKEEIRVIVKEANAMGIEIIPMFNHLGHASSARSCIGKHVVLDQNPDLDYLFNTNGWEWDFESEEVYELLRKIREELIELCGEGKYFHLGCDEAYSLGYGENRGAELGKYLTRVQEELSQIGRRGIIWGDMLLYETNFKEEPEHYSCTIENEAISKAFRENLSRDIIIADWQYYQTGDVWKSSVSLIEDGFEVIACPWDMPENTKSGVKNAMKPQMYGLMHTTWHTLNRYYGFSCMLYAGLASWSGDLDVIKPKPLQFYSAATARKVLPSNGIYAKAGWNDKEIGPGL